MLPYPSGTLHMGHVKNYTMGDVIARFRARNGSIIFHPMGYDAFGLNTENVAIKTGIHPAELTKINTGNINRQLHRLGVSIDWSRELATCDPEYYRWTQYFFLKFYERGLAYKKEAPVNWCPSCQTVLANEQVVQGGCERCSTPVEQTSLAQWFFKITDYAERLLKDFDQLQSWPERVITMQRNWIGRSVGAEVIFRVDELDLDIPVFTTRPDTLFGATFFLLAPEHELVGRITEGMPEADAVTGLRDADAAEADDRSRRHRPGEDRRLHRTLCREPGQRRADPHLGERLCAHGIRHRRHHGRARPRPARLRVRPQVRHRCAGGGLGAAAGDAGRRRRPKRVRSPDAGPTMEAAFEEEGPLVNSGRFDGVDNREAGKAITDWLESEGKGKAAISYRLRDWLVSRQRYWGAPIPIIYCDKCGIVPVPEKDLPVLLPDVEDYAPKGKSPDCRQPGFRQHDLSPDAAARPPARPTRWTPSSIPRGISCAIPIRPTTARPSIRRIANYWMPVDQYIGGVEHAILHLMYARFFTKVLYDLDMVDFEEPFNNLFTQGMIYYQGAKMSKSKGNVINPDDHVERYGADTLRLYILFMGPPELDVEWQDQGIEGTFRFLGRVWRLVNEIVEKVEPLSNSDFNRRGRRSAQAGAQGQPDHSQGERRRIRAFPLQHRHQRRHGAGQRRLSGQGRAVRDRRRQAACCVSSPRPWSSCSIRSRRTSAPSSGSAWATSVSGSSPGPGPTSAFWKTRPMSWWYRSTAKCATACRYRDPLEKKSCCKSPEPAKRSRSIPRISRSSRKL